MQQTIKIQNRPKDAPWYNSELRRLKRLSLRLRKKAQNKKSQENWEAYKKVRKSYIKECRRAKADHPNKCAEQLSNTVTNPRKWWSKVNQILKPNKNQSIPPIISSSGQLVAHPKDKANVLNKFFTDQTVIFDENIPTPLLTSKTDTRLDHINVTEEETVDILKSLDTSKACGPDEVHAKLLKECAIVVSKPLTKLFNISLETGLYPEK